MLKPRKFGWRPEVSWPPRDAVAWANPGVYIPERCSLFDNIDTGGVILDQTDTSSCVAHAVASAIRLRIALQSRRLGVDMAGRRIDAVPLPSRHWIYRLARESHGDAHIDDGTFIASAIHVIQELGWPTEEHCPWNPDAVNDGVSRTHRMHAADQRISIKQRPISASHPRKNEMIRSAIADGYPVIFGARVDGEFRDCEAWTPLTLSGQSIGGHAMVIFGYDPDGAYVLNSWGCDWGMGGLGLLAWSAVVDHCRDIRVVETVRKPTS